MTTNIVMEMGYAADLHREALIATGVVLFVFILLINMIFSATEEEDKGMIRGYLRHPGSLLLRAAMRAVGGHYGGRFAAGGGLCAV